MKDLNKEKSDKSVQQSRGPELREKMIQSQEKGEEYRSEHQGTDQKTADLGKSK